MEHNANAILEAAMLLPEEERLVLVSRLLESVSSDNSEISVEDPAFIEELDRRSADRQESIPWSELRAEG